MVNLYIISFSLIFVIAAPLGDSFVNDFTNRSYSLTLFVEDNGVLRTDSCLACEHPQNIVYNVTLDGLPSPANRRGLKLLMNNVNATCTSSSQISVGHLSSITYYSYGDFEMYGMVGHSPNGSYPPLNTFTCFSAFVGTSTAEYHNELAFCWPASNPFELHMSYWIGNDGDVIHGPKVKIFDFDMTKTYHRYTVQWRSSQIRWMVDGIIVWTNSADPTTTNNNTPTTIGPRLVPSFFSTTFT